MTPSLVLVAVEQKEPFWQYLSQSFDLNRYAGDIARALKQTIRKTRNGVARHKSLGAQLVKHTPSLRQLLVDRQATALVALNDMMAREFFLWAQYVGIGIPSGFSMVSFDNRAGCSHFPVTTIDFGLARLGYLAAHVLIGDIPVRADKNGCIPGQPILVDRGSVAKPGDRAAVRRLLRIS
jgi:DNA-binding LacI/PurR family transcriptional regulator